MRNICISAIHTDAGKSCVSAALCYAFGFEYFKLIQAGSITDKSFVEAKVANLVSHAPGISLKTAASPHVGMIKENVTFEGLKIDIPKQNGVLVELAGGLYCPMDSKKYMIDYIEAKKLPTFLVSRNYLGSINHTVLSLEALKSKNIEILGVIFSDEKDELSEEYLKRQYPNLNFFNLKNFDKFGFENAADDLGKQILKAGVRL